jgi:hypothetical protein
MVFGKIAVNDNLGGSTNGILASISTFPIIDIDGSTHILHDTPSINLSTGALIVERQYHLARNCLYVAMFPGQIRESMCFLRCLSQYYS